MTTVKYPCILVCAIEPESGHCYGCGRSRDEIAGWLGMDDETRERLMREELPARLSGLTRKPRRITKRARQRGIKPRRDTLDLSSAQNGEG